MIHEETKLIVKWIKKAEQDIEDHIPALTDSEKGVSVACQKQVKEEYFTNKSLFRNHMLPNQNWLPIILYIVFPKSDLLEFLLEGYTAGLRLKKASFVSHQGGNNSLHIQLDSSKEIENNYQFQPVLLAILSFEYFYTCMSKPFLIAYDNISSESTEKLQRQVS